MTYIIIFLTVVVSIVCFGNRPLADRLALQPFAVFKRHQWDRLITHGFVHGDYTHLLVNMFVFWSFGSNVERLFRTQEFAGVVRNGTLTFLVLYFGGMIFASIYDLYKYRNNPAYVSIGASGAVAATVFTSIFFDPLGMIYFFGFLPIPGILFGILYILYEGWSGRRAGDSINHNAHLFGALYGFIYPLFISPSLIHVFLNGLRF